MEEQDKRGWKRIWRELKDAAWEEFERDPIMTAFGVVAFVICVLFAAMIAAALVKIIGR